MEILKKISVKEVCGNPRKLLGGLDKIPLMQVVGEIVELETGNSSFNDESGEPQKWTAFVGQFKATNLSTRQQYFAGRCFLPAIMADLLIAQVKSCPGVRVQFGCIIGIKDAPDVATGYEYYAQSLIPMEESNDPFKAIENKMAPDPVFEYLKGQAESNGGKLQDIGQSGGPVNPGGVTDPSQIAEPG